jgi:hypothetical protein
MDMCRLSGPGGDATIPTVVTLLMTSPPRRLTMRTSILAPEYRYQAGEVTSIRWASRETPSSWRFALLEGLPPGADIRTRWRSG